MLSEDERGTGQLSAWGCDNPQRLPTIRDRGFIGTPNAIATVRTQSRRSLSRSTTEQEQVCLQASRPLNSTHNPSRESFFAFGLALPRPVPWLSADPPPSLFSLSALQSSSAQGCVGSPSRRFPLQPFGLLCGKLVKSFNPCACSLQKVTDTLDSLFFPQTTHSRRLHQRDHEQHTFGRWWHRRREHRRGEETSKSQTASTAQQLS